MKKSLIALVVSATFLAACGGSDNKNETPDLNESPVLTADTASTLNGESITIDVWHTFCERNSPWLHTRTHGKRME